MDEPKAAPFLEDKSAEDRAFIVALGERISRSSIECVRPLYPQPADGFPILCRAYIMALCSAIFAAGSSLGLDREAAAAEACDLITRAAAEMDSIDRQVASKLN